MDVTAENTRKFSFAFAQKDTLTGVSSSTIEALMSLTGLSKNRSDSRACARWRTDFCRYIEQDDGALSDEHIRLSVTQVCKRAFQRKDSRKGFFNCQHRPPSFARSPRQVVTLFASGSSVTGRARAKTHPLWWLYYLADHAVMVVYGPARKQTKSILVNSCLTLKCRLRGQGYLSHRTKSCLSTQVKPLSVMSGLIQAPGFAGASRCQNGRAPPELYGGDCRQSAV